ncbi:unnamed protein product, partial [Didymodactylos carnosus]
MSVNKTLKKQKYTDRKTSANIETIEAVKQENDNSVNALDYEGISNWPADEQYRHSSRKGKIVTGHKKKRRLAMTDGSVQTQQTAITLDDGMMNGPRKVVGKHIEIQSVPPYNFDELILNSNGEEKADQTQVALAAEDRLVEVIDVEEKRQTTGAVNDFVKDIENDLSPIVEYAREPLLPLAEACAPLESIVHDLYVYVQLALDETPIQPPDGLTIDESAAIRLYTIEW